mgnify:CR=1 FL=1
MSLERNQVLTSVHDPARLAGITHGAYLAIDCLYVGCTDCVPRRVFTLSAFRTATSAFRKATGVT